MIAADALNMAKQAGEAGSTMRGLKSVDIIPMAKPSKTVGFKNFDPIADIREFHKTDTPTASNSKSTRVRPWMTMVRLQSPKCELLRRLKKYYVGHVLYVTTFLTMFAFHAHRKSDSSSDLNPEEHDDLKSHADDSDSET
jgi:hypothetical protein